MKKQNDWIVFIEIMLVIKRLKIGMPQETLEELFDRAMDEIYE